MAKQELEYSNCKTIANKVEVLVLNTGLLTPFGVAKDFLYFLIQNGLNEYWSGTYTISSVFTDVGLDIEENVKFEFVRLVGTREGSGSSSMGGGTQWVSDVVELMKEYLEKGFSDWSEGTKLVFRVDDKQFEWS